MDIKGMKCDSKIKLSDEKTIRCEHTHGHWGHCQYTAKTPGNERVVKWTYTGGKSNG